MLKSLIINKDDTDDVCYKSEVLDASNREIIDSAVI